MSIFSFSVCRNHKKLLVALLALVLACFCVFTLGSRPRQTYLLFKVVSLQQAPLQIFFDTGKGFEEKSTQLRIIPGGNIIHAVRFPVPVKPIHALRIDPAPDTDLRIVEISLVDQWNALITKLDTTSLLALNDIAAIQVTDKGSLIAVNGLDPQLKLEISPSLVMNYGFNWLLACIVFCMLYCIFWGGPLLVLLLFRRTAGHESQLGPSLIRIPHMLILVAGGLGIAGASVLWVSEGQSPLRKDQGGHDLVPYEKTITAEPVTFQRQADGLSLAGLLYRARDMNKSTSAVLLLHGNYPQGSAYPLYKVLAEELALRGYTVLAMDFSGFGKSADPFVFGEIESLDLNRDAAAGVEFLLRQSKAAPAYLHVIGHSMGADPAMSIGRASDAIRSIALIGPPRRVFKRFNYPPDINFFWDWALQVRKTVYNKQDFPDWYSKDLWRQQILDRNMVQNLPYFAQWGHKPILFMDGERELGPDKRFLQWYFCRTSWPKQYITLNQATHDCNVVIRQGRIFYDQTVMDQAVTALDKWFRRSEDQKYYFFDIILNVLRRLFAVEMLKGC